LHPNADLQGNGYQLLQSKIGLGAGGLTGLGLATVERSGDCFPTPHRLHLHDHREELGLIGTLSSLLCSLHSSRGSYRGKCTMTSIDGGHGIATWITIEA